MNWIKRHKFWAGILVLLATGFAVERLTGVEAAYIAIYLIAGTAIATWLIFKVGGKLFNRDEERPPQQTNKVKEAE